MAQYLNKQGLQTYDGKIKEYIASQISYAISGVTQFDVQVVDELPSTGVKGTIYLIANNESLDQDVYNEYIYTNDTWELIGNTKVDLSGYLTTSDAQSTYLSKKDASSTYATKAEIPTIPDFTDTNTTYSFTSGTNGFTVTPSTGSQTSVTVTPEIKTASMTADSYFQGSTPTPSYGADVRGVWLDAKFGLDYSTQTISSGEPAMIAPKLVQVRRFSAIASSTDETNTAYIGGVTLGEINKLYNIESGATKDEPIPTLDIESLF